MSQQFYYQMVSRNNDVNGNPYRMIFVYDDKGNPVEVYEARSSTPNKEYDFYSKDNFHKLITLHLSPEEYNDLKRRANIWVDVKGVINCD